MLTRFLQVVYCLSIIWLALVVGLSLAGNADDALFPIVWLAWPSVLALLLCFILGGRFLLATSGKVTMVGRAS
jgi:hypothetical protein